MTNLKTLKLNYNSKEHFDKPHLMRKFRKIASILFALFFTLSCEDDIKINLPETENKAIVIEAILFSGLFISLNQEVKLSYSTSYSNSTKVTPIGDAKVMLISNYNDTINPIFSNSLLGTYRFSNEIFKTGNKYKLRVETKKETYESPFEEVMDSITIDSITSFSSSYLMENGYMFTNLETILSNSNYPVITIKDIKDKDNYYLIGTNYNINSMRLLDDRLLGDGVIIPFEYLWINRPLDFAGQEKLITFYVYNINFGLYKYLLGIQNLNKSNDPFSTPPSNPISNIECITNEKEEVLLTSAF